MKNIWQKQTIILYKYRLTFNVKERDRYIRKTIWASCASVACNALFDYVKREGMEIKNIRSVFRESAA